MPRYDIQNVKFNGKSALKYYSNGVLIWSKPVDPPTGGSTPRVIPDKNTVTYTDAPITLTNSMIVSGEIKVSGKKIRELSNLGYCINTSQLSTRCKIIIEDCILCSPGMPIFGYDYRHDWEIRNNIFFGVRGVTNPRTSWGRWGVRINNPYTCVIENNYFEDLGAVKLEYGTSTECLGYQIRLNKMVNVYQPDGLMNFINIKGANGTTVPNQEIGWNLVVNDPDLCKVEDTINIYTMRAPSTSPARIHNNLSDGAWNGKLDTSYSGGGFILDGKGENNSSDCCDYWVVENNHMIRQCNYMLGVALATNSIVRNNRCIVAALFEDGTRYKSWTSGIWVDDYSSGDNVTANIQVYGNVVGARNGTSGRMDYGYYPSGQTHTSQWDNISLPEPLTRALEDAEYDIWYAKLANNNYVVGPIETTSGFPYTLPLTLS